MTGPVMIVRFLDLIVITNSFLSADRDLCTVFVLLNIHISIIRDINTIDVVFRSNNKCKFDANHV